MAESETDGAEELVVPERRGGGIVEVRETNFEVQVIVMGGTALRREDHVVEKDRRILEVFRNVVVEMNQA